MALKSSTSAAESSRVAGATSTFFVFVGRMIDPSVMFESTRTSAMLRSTVLRSIPRPTVRFACGSRSRQRTSCPNDASAPPRLMAHVVLPTPPFWFAIAMTLPNRALLFADPTPWARFELLCSPQRAETYAPQPSEDYSRFGSLWGEPSGPSRFARGPVVAALRYLVGLRALSLRSRARRRRAESLGGTAGPLASLA